MSAEEMPQAPIQRRRTPPAWAAYGAVPDRPPPRVGRARTRFVTLLKAVLPVLAVALLAMLIAWPRLRDAAPSIELQDTGAIEMLNARYVGADDKRRPFSVIADNAARSTGNPDVLDMRNPEAEMTQENGTWVAMKAQHGRYDEQTGLLTLEGAVNLFHDEGYEFVTDAAQLDTNKGLAWGDRPVTGQGPMGELFANGFRLYDEGKTIVFTGHAHLTLRGAAPSREAQ